MNNFYKFLDIKEISHKYKKTFENSIKNAFNCNEVNIFNANYNLFDIDNLDFKRFNSKYYLIKLLKKKKSQKIHINGHIFKALIKYNNKYIFKNIFCKECPCYNPLYINIGNNNDTSYYQFLLNDFMYNLNSSVNIEILVSYLLSKLVEHNISPHFPLYYGNCNTNMKKYTSEISDKEISKLDKNLKYPIVIYSDSCNSYLQRFNFPVNLIFSEKLEDDLYNYCNNKIFIDNLEWTSYLFQIIMALSVCQKYFGVYHNDLHLSNVMFSNTDKEYIYYSYKKIYYKIPTYNKIIKIIDWGRATYNFNNKIGNNFIFRKDGDAFGQYYYQKINNKGKRTIPPNPSVDLALLAGNFINEKSFPKKGKLYNLIKSWITFDKKLINLNLIKDNSFEFYTIVSHNSCNSIPIKQITKKIFKQFIVDKDLIPKDSIIYGI